MDGKSHRHNGDLLMKDRCAGKQSKALPFFKPTGSFGHNVRRLLTISEIRTSVDVQEANPELSV